MNFPRNRTPRLGIEPLGTKIVPSAPPFQIVGTTLVIAPAPGGHEFAEVSYPDAFNPNVLEVDYGTQGLGGPVTSYTIDATTVKSLAFVASGTDNILIDDVVDKPALFTGVTSNSTVVDGPEYDVVVFYGTGNFAPPSDNNAGTPADVLYPNL